MLELELPPPEELDDIADELELNELDELDELGPCELEDVELDAGVELELDTALELEL